MKKTQGQMVRGWAAGLVLGVAGIAMSAGVCVAQDSTPKQDDKAEMLDVLVFRNGNRVEGRVLSETDTVVKFRLMTAGISAETEYRKAEILSIQREAVRASAGPAVAKRGEAARSVEGAKGERGVGDPATAPRVYTFTLEGEYARNFNITPLRKVLEDARKFEPDYLLVKVDCEFKSRGEEIPDFAPDPEAFDEIFEIKKMAVLFTDDIDAWQKRPKVIFWIKRALGTVAFIPFASPDVYYSPDALHGGIGYLDLLFDGIGDEVVREKQRSLRLAEALGIAIRSGYDDKIIKAMARADYVLSVTFEGGAPVFYEDESGDILLTDDANKEAGRRDTVEDAIRHRGNDVLNLTSDMALRLGVSKGTVDSDSELIDVLGLSRHYRIIEGRGNDILKDWGKRVAEAEFRIRQIRREMQSLTVKEPGGYDERTQYRGKMKQLARDIIRLLETYKESINPFEIRANPEGLLQQLRLLIDQIEQEQRRDKK